MPEITDDRLAEELRKALAVEALSIEVTDAAGRVARARARRARDRSRRPWALAGIAAALVVACVAGIGFAAWRTRPATGLPGTTGLETASATASVESSGTPAVTLTPAGRFILTGSMATVRGRGETSTLLADGRVLIAGCDYGAVPVVSTAELYDPATGKFSRTGSMITARIKHTATLLSDGRVLIAGGADPTGQGALSSAELYDPATGKFSPTGSLTAGRLAHTATLLSDGRVLIAGGFGASGPVATAELYDPATGKFSPTGSLNYPRQSGHTATLLSDGRVLVAGGMGISPLDISETTARAEIYDPSTGRFSPTGSMAAPRIGHTATLLRDGRVLIAGGPNPAELYDPRTGAFSPSGSMITARTDQAATRFADGRVLIAGGVEYTTSAPPLASAELYDPTTGTFSPTGSMAISRRSPSATLLADGHVLVADGSGDASAELYVP